MARVRLILVGGFLGAGKTTLLGEAAGRLADRGKRVGLITNDQASHLVDSAALERKGFTVGEVSGGCFCCQFEKLVSQATKLRSQLAPDILLAEPVGSCTDISATVIQPLKELCAEWFHTSPFSVLVDPVRLREAVGAAPGGLSDSVLYIFRKQLEESDVIVVNKADLLADGELGELEGLLSAEFPGAALMRMSALRGEGVDAWLEHVMREDRAAGRRIAEVDYDVYAEGEAVLGWLNASVELQAGTRVDWRAFCLDVLRRIRAECEAVSAEIAHAKLLLSASEGSIVANLTATNGAPRAEGTMLGVPGKALLLVNARVHTDPDALRAIVERSLDGAADGRVATEIIGLESFRPARPVPHHRYASVVDPP